MLRAGFSGDGISQALEVFRQRRVRSRELGGERGDGIRLVWNFWVCQNKRHNLRRTLHCKPLFCPELMSEIPSLQIHCFGLRCPLQNARLPSWYHMLINQSPYEGSEGRRQEHEDDGHWHYINTFGGVKKSYCVFKESQV